MIICPKCKANIIGTLVKDNKVYDLEDTDVANQECHECGFRFHVFMAEVRDMIEDTK